MLAKLKRKLRELKALPPGERFQTVNEQQSGGPAWVRPVVIAGAVIAFGIGILLSVLPGPAFVFYALAGALAAIESKWVARTLDRGELALRKLLAHWHRWRASKSRKRVGAKEV
jgi:hypothetical protein